MSSGRRKHGLAITLGVLAGLLVAFMAFVELFPSSERARQLISSSVSGFIDAQLECSDVDVSILRDFPSLVVSVDSLSITYPHDRFDSVELRTSVHNPLSERGRGEEADTLLSASRIFIGIKPWRIVSGKIFIREAYVSGLRLNAHQYDDSTANWNVFIPRGDSDANSSLPLVLLRDFHIGDGSEIVYTNAAEGIFAALDLDSLRIRGALEKKGESLSVKGSRIGLGAFLDLDLPRRPEIRVPLRIALDADYFKNTLGSRLKIRNLDGNLAHVPLHAGGDINSLGRDSTCVDAQIQIKDCPLDTLLGEYGVKFFAKASDFGTNGRASLDLKAKGVLSGESYPEIDACFRIAPSRVYYYPMDFRGRLVADLDASLSSSGKLDLDVREFDTVFPGLSFSLGGNVSDLLGKDPHMDIRSDAGISLDTLMKWIPDNLGIDASGYVETSIIADAYRSNLTKYDFEKAFFQADINAGRLNLKLPESRLALNSSNPTIRAVSNRMGITVDVDVDSLYFRKGEELAAMVRKMSNKGFLTNIKTRGGYAPRLELDNSQDAVFLRAGHDRFILKDLCFGASIQKSLRTKAGMRRHRNRINIDSNLTAYIRQWNPTARISASKGFVRMRSLPLRTGISGFEGFFDGDTLAVDSLKVVSGTSDVSVRGRISGLRRNMLRGYGKLDMELALNSGRLNLNELLSALQAGRDIARDTSVTETEAYMIDTLENSVYTPGNMPRILLPSNVSASVKLDAREVNYTYMDIRPLTATLSLRDRTLQLLDAKAFSDLGNLTLNAFYSTKKPDKGDAGLDLSLSGIQADGLLQMLPSFDTMMPALKSFKGNLDCNLYATASIDTMMNVIVPSMDGLISIEGKDLMVEDAGGLRKITRLLRFRNKDIGSIQDLRVNAVIHDSKVEIFPFELGVDRYKLALYGMQGIDKSMYYHASILKSPFLLKFGVNVYGTLDNWEYRLTLPKYREGEIPVYTAQINSMRLNIANSIRDIFTGGVDEVLRYNRNVMRSIPKTVVPEEEDSLEDRLKASELQFEYDIILEENDLSKEVDEALESSFKDVEEMMAGYAGEVYDKNILTRLKQLKNKKKQ